MGVIYSDRPIPLSYMWGFHPGLKIHTAYLLSSFQFVCTHLIPFPHRVSRLVFLLIQWNTEGVPVTFSHFDFFLHFLVYVWEGVLHSSMQHGLDPYSLETQSIISVVHATAAAHNSCTRGLISPACIILKTPRTVTAPRRHDSLKQLSLSLTLRCSWYQLTPEIKA